ncbi:MAG: radical SAM protein [Candidatus Latescibacteria bacterium]|nr:radical SAM protein [Candidatus Latescibacterota bacterium]NIM21747.1 radical SAM protein [Candidatus Latescibacterota bacterium]NIM65885.1 radical SAM protein [Candidatus Latescibacterota bacterium]NIO02630.1 radical SAM protein [Candidatus Latescibacterota bacterium]NIO29611.1 radical SAM protein [Candidatus Latescibacterota bacterium]
MLLQLQRGIIYGPIRSRRLGASLGINLMPNKCKLCSFNCVYCHYGPTKRLAVDLVDFHDDLPALDDVVKAVDRAVRSKTAFAYLTFSGNGEPTLYPWFPELVDEVVRLRDRYRPEVRVALLSNSSGLVFGDVRDAVSKIDLPVFKLDAGTEKKWKAINRPDKDVDFCEMVDSLTALENIYVQTVLIDGDPGNIADEDLEAYFEKLNRIRPIEAHLYSIDRPVPNTRISLVPPAKLQEIAQRGQKPTGVKMKAFYDE